MEVDIYGGQEPRQLALYNYTDAAHYLDIPVSTVRAWARGGSYTSGNEKRRFPPVLSSSAKEKPIKGLSFLDLTELFVLKALRRDRKVSLEKIRSALKYAEDKLGIEKLLLTDILTHGGDMFIEYYGDYVSVSKNGQIALEAVLRQYLSRVDRDSRLTPITLHPIVEGFGEEKPVAINPRVSFGKPTITGTGTNTVVVAIRHEAGETVEEIADDYSIDPQYIRGAIAYEYRAAA